MSPKLTKKLLDIYAIVPKKNTHSPNHDVNACAINTSNFLTRKAKENHEHLATDSAAHTTMIRVPLPNKFKINVLIQKSGNGVFARTFFLAKISVSRALCLKRKGRRWGSFGGFQGIFWARQYERSSHDPSWSTRGSFVRAGVRVTRWILTCVCSVVFIMLVRCG